jgi:TIR domain
MTGRRTTPLGHCQRVASLTKAIPRRHDTRLSIGLLPSIQSVYLSETFGSAFNFDPAVDAEERHGYVRRQFAACGTDEWHPFARKSSRLHQTDYLALGAVGFIAGFAATNLRHYQAGKAAMRSAARSIAGSEVGQGSSHDWGVEKRLREELAKLQVEINEVWRDKSGIKSGDDWRRGIIDDLKDADWVLSFLSRHSIRDPGVCLELGIALHGKGGAIATVLIEGATGRPCGRAHIRDSLAIVCSRAARHSGVTAGELQKRHLHGGAAYRDTPWRSRASRTRNSSPALFRWTVTRSPQPRRIGLVDGLAVGIGCGHSLSQGCALGNAFHLRQAFGWRFVPTCIAG